MRERKAFGFCIGVPVSTTRLRQTPRRASMVWESKRRERREWVRERGVWVLHRRAREHDAVAADSTKGVNGPGIETERTAGVGGREGIRTEGGRRKWMREGGVWVLHRP